MSRAYDALEPAVIDEKLLRTCVDELVAEAQSAQQQQLQAGVTNENVAVIRNANTDPVDFHEVPTLRLDYRNICRIDNLWQFSRLTRLQLDNNIIERIEGLETLTGLTLLDLSFNNLESISGLETLTNLEDLILNNNRLVKIQNLESLKSLRVLNLSTNLIKNHEDCTKLRCLPQLKSLILKDNIFGINKDEYYDFIVAFLPNLAYLDFRLVSASKRAAAQNRFETKLDELHAKENGIRLKSERAKKETDLITLYKNSHVLNLSKMKEVKNSLFLSMFKDDVDGQLLLERPEICKLTAAYKNELEKEEQYLFEYGLKQFEVRKIDREDLCHAKSYADMDAKKECRKQIDQFLIYKRDALAKMVDATKEGESSELQELKEEFDASLDDLWKYLMTVETDLVDRIDESLGEFERNYRELIGVFMEQAMASFAKIREQQLEYFEKVKEVAVEVSEKIHKDDQAAKPKDNPYLQALKNLEIANKRAETIDDGTGGMQEESNGFDDFDDEDEDEHKLSEDAKIKIYADKETVVNAATASNDSHTGILDDVEDALKESVNVEQTSCVDKIRKAEIRRSRSRLAEITKFIDAQKNDVLNVVIL